MLCDGRLHLWQAEANASRHGFVDPEPGTAVKSRYLGSSAPKAEWVT